MSESEPLQKLLGNETVITLNDAFLASLPEGSTLNISPNAQTIYDALIFGLRQDRGLSVTRSQINKRLKDAQATATANRKIAAELPQTEWLELCISVQNIVNQAVSTSTSTHTASHRNTPRTSGWSADAGGCSRPPGTQTSGWGRA
jgi:hypothetical protein